MGGIKMKQDNFLKRWTDTVYGGLNMSWSVVIIYAVLTAVVTAVFLIVPVFSETSFYYMGVTFEAWIFFAVIIMANCRTPLDSALKTFVFFLISQPLIYLFQVPFSSMGWNLLGYYRYWALWTIATLPMAYVGWYIRKKNWLSVLILLPVMFVLALDGVGSLMFAFRHFPRRLLKGIFCTGQVLLYAYVFTSDLKQRLAAAILPFVVYGILSITRPPMELTVNYFLPDDPVLTENAVIEVADPKAAEISVYQTGEDSMIQIHAANYGNTDFTITDGSQVYHYNLEIYEDDGGHSQIRITRID